MNDEELAKKLELLMYFFQKEAARMSLTEFLENINITMEEYQEIKESLASKYGIKF